MLPKSKNSWVLSVANKTHTKYNHHYFCRCTKEFKLKTEINKPEAPDVLCPLCGNDYFKDAVVFESMNSTKIWKYFDWTSVVYEDDKYWKIILQYEVPSYNPTIDIVKLINITLLEITFSKDGYLGPKVNYKSKIVQKYSLFLDNKMQTFKNLLLHDAKLSLYQFIISRKKEYLDLLDARDSDILSPENKLKCVKQIQMLDSTLKQRQERIIIKTLYQSYQTSINKIGYYPCSDYIFSRSIENIDLLIKLYKIEPEIKKHIFTDETFTVAIEFILFLKQYYLEKQIVRLFVENSAEYKHTQHNLGDTLRMLKTPNAFNSLKKHFSKVKLTTKKLHDEVVRVFHIVSYELDAKENFEYNKISLSACVTYQGLEFKLPSTVQELSLWAKQLHNCMFGYSRRIHQQQSIIYGVFRAEELLYAIELDGFRVVQARAIFNHIVPTDDMNIINSWKEININSNFVLNSKRI